MKKFASIIGSVALLAFAVIPAVAAGNTCGNGTTGPFSQNDCTVNNTSNVSVTNYNDAKVVNNVSSSSNTGHNTTSFNTLGGQIVTGNATLNTTVSTVANVNTTNVTGGASMGNNTGSNSITGPGMGGAVSALDEVTFGGPKASNTVYINNEQRVNVDNQNTAVVVNNVGTDTNTGYNMANANTGPAIVHTGNAVLTTGVSNHVNDNATRVVAGAGGTGGNVAANDTTGPFSNNMVTLNNLSDVTVRNYNDMLVTNNVSANSNTGYNSASKNTLGGEIVSGFARVGLGVDSEGNINTTTVASAMGGFGNAGENEITGPGSSNNTYVNNDQTISVDNMNNKCMSHNASSVGQGNCNPWDLGVTNNVGALSDSGFNYADVNTGGGSVMAMMSEVFQSVLTHINDSWTTITQ